MGLIPEETIERILEATDIVDLIGGYFPLKRAGSNYLALCPFHSENTPSFNVNPGRQFYHCFGCGASGDAIGFVKAYENLTFPEAARKLADRAGVLITEEAYDPESERKRRSRGRLRQLQKDAAEWFHLLLFKKDFAQPARDYLRSRGIGMETARAWLLGYAPENQRLFFDWARSAGYPMEQLVDGGLAKWRDENHPGRGAYAFFRHRLMFPVNNENGDPVAFSGRVLSPDQRGGKYVNSPETSIFSKSKTFFGLDRSKRPILQAKRAIVFEGQLDLITAHEEGIDNVVAPLGTAFTEEHARVLSRHTEEVVLAYDSDRAGMKAAGKTFRLLAGARDGVGVLVRLALLPEGEDPDSFIRQRGAEAFRGILDQSREYFDHLVDTRGAEVCRGPLRDRLAFAKELADDVALVREKMLQDSLIHRIATRLGVGEPDIRKLVADAVSSRKRFEKSRTRRENIARKRAEEDARRNGHDPDDATGVPVEIHNRSVRLLARALLTCPETRERIASRPLPPFLADLPETELLSKLWTAPIDPARPASVNAFVATLPPDEQATVSRLLSEEGPAPSGELSTGYVLQLKRQSLQLRIRETEARLGAPDLDSGQVANLTKQLLDLRKQRDDIPRPR